MRYDDNWKCRTISLRNDFTLLHWTIQHWFAFIRLRWIKHPWRLTGMFITFFFLSEKVKLSTTPCLPRLVCTTTMATTSSWELHAESSTEWPRWASLILVCYITYEQYQCFFGHVPDNPIFIFVQVIPTSSERCPQETNKHFPVFSCYDILLFNKRAEINHCCLVCPWNLKIGICTVFCMRLTGLTIMY